MTARTRLAPEDQMTMEEFLAFTDTRPDEERWELIEGVPVMSPSPVSPRSLPQPDVFVKEEATTGSAVTDDALVLFEVLSRSNTKADQAWRRKVYASVPNCRHYVTVSLKAVVVDAYDRDTGWKKRTVSDLAGALDLSALVLAIPLADIYRWTPFDRASD